jgi:hypothetical protein
MVSQIFVDDKPWMDFATFGFMHCSATTLPKENYLNRLHPKGFSFQFFSYGW